MDCEKKDKLNLDFIKNWEPYFNTVPNEDNSQPILHSTATANSSPWFMSDLASTGMNPTRIQLNGEDADIMVGEKSLMQILDGIEQRLGLLQCRHDLESEWLELKSLGDQYRNMVKTIEQKAKMWNALKHILPEG